MAGLSGLPLTPGTHEQVIGFLFFVLTFAGVGLGLGSAVSRRSLAEAELASNQARLDRVVSGARLGLWDWDVPGDRVAYNLRCAELLGTPLAPLEPTRQAWDDAIHPEEPSARGGRAGGPPGGPERLLRDRLSYPIR